MECPKDCPVIAGFAEKIGEMNADIVRMQELRQQNDTAMAQNQETATKLRGLPLSREVADARGMLQEAVIQLANAQTQVTDSIDLLYTAIDASQTAAEVTQGSCPGEPRYMDDPTKPGSMILICANPYAYEQ